jgi:hypothetical protein
MNEGIIENASLQEAETVTMAIDGAETFRQSDAGQAVEQFKWIYTGRELLEAPLTKPPCLLEPVLQTTGFSLLLGESDIGKTWLALSLALAVASRKSEWLGYKLKPTHGRAILIATEDSEHNLAGRFRSLQKAFPAADWQDNILVIIADDKSNAEIIKALSSIIATNPVDLIIGDCFGDMFEGRDGNSQADARQFYKLYAKLSKECQFMLVHHKGKRTEDKAPNKNHALGSQAIEAKARTVFDLTESKGLFYFTVLKCKTSRDEKKNSKRLEFDEGLLIFRDTGETVARTEIGAQAVATFAWAPLFVGKAKLTKSELADSYSTLTSKSRATAFAKIKIAVERGELRKDEFGNILNPNEPKPERDIQDLSSLSNTPRDLDRLDKEEAPPFDTTDLNAKPYQPTRIKRVRLAIPKKTQPSIHPIP